MTSETTERPSILVVDDEPDIVELYAEWLHEDYDVTAVTSGADALDALHPGIDVILLDRDMPELTGDDVLVTLRDWGMLCRVVLVTGTGPVTDIQDLGFDDYLQKPVSRDDIREVVEELLDTDSIDVIRNRLSSLQVTRNVLELESDEADLSENEDFRRLCDRIDHLEAELADRREMLADQPTN